MPRWEVPGSIPLVSKPILLGLALVVGLLAFQLTAAAQPRPLVVLTEASLIDGVSYDAWIGFKDKGRSTPEKRREIWTALEKELHPRALARRKAKLSFPGLFD